MKRIAVALVILTTGIIIVNTLPTEITRLKESVLSWQENALSYVPWLKQEDSQSSIIESKPAKEAVIVKGGDEERLVKTIETALPSVVTIGININVRERSTLQFDPANPFDGWRRVPGRSREVEQNIGSGFVITADGLIITNKHVVDAEDATYTVLLGDETTYTVEKIYRDPLNDLAILKINPKTSLTPLTLGSSDQLKLGQTTIAIGTPLGEFTNTVTTGIISGLGRGITAGSPFEGYVERLDNVIQTDAAISPGNSGGPLLNSSGHVIGVNTAVSSEGSNIGFAIPVNIVKALIREFDGRGGSFERPYLGVRYQMLDRKTAIANELVEGAYVTEVIEGSPAEDAGVVVEDVITKVDGKKIDGTDDQSLIKILLTKKVGQTVSVTLYREGEEKTVSMTLKAMQ